MKYIVVLLFISMMGCQSNFFQRNYEIAKESAEQWIQVQQITENSKSLENMKVQDCIQEALAENPDFISIQHRILQAMAISMSAQAEFLPILTLRGRYFHADSPAIYFATKLDQHEFQLKGDLNNPKDFGSSQVGIGFGERINLAGREFLRKDIANIQLEIAQLQQDSARNFLVDQVIIAYYDILASKKYVFVAEQSVHTVNVELEETKTKFDGGGALKSDVLALEVRLASAKEDVIKAKNRYDLAVNALAYLMGKAPDTIITLVEEDWNPTKLPPSYKEGIIVALAKRPEIYEVRKQILASRYGIDMAKSYYWPDLEAFGSYYWEDRDFKYSKNQDNWQIGVAIQWNIFDGQRTRSKVWQAEEIYQELLQADKKTVLAISHEVNAAYRNWQEALERTKVLDIAISQAKENLELVKKQFEGGSATITKYLDSELAYTQTQFQGITAQYDVKKASASVGKALGLCGLCAIGQTQY